MLQANGHEIRAVTFDAGMTLIEPWPSVGHVYAEVAAEHGISGLDPDELTQRFAVAWKKRPSFGYTRAAWAEVVDETFDGLLPKSPSSSSLFDTIYQRFDEPRAWRIYNDVLPALDVLRERGVKLGIISNWDDRLRPLLGELELIDYFNAVVVSCEVGATKPAREMFDAAAQGLGEPPAHILHVGDSMEADVEGARSAGFAAALLKRNGVNHSPDCVSHLGEVVECLSRSRQALRG